MVSVWAVGWAIQYIKSGTSSKDVCTGVVEGTLYFDTWFSQRERVQENQLQRMDM